MVEIDMDAVRDLAHQLVTELQENPSIISPWMSPEAAAAYLSLQPRGLEKIRRENRGPRFHRMNARCIRYNRADLDAWVMEHGETGR